ncbi:hypothetical protein [Rathayibacter sp. AY1E1]|uniref:hypothetical protein n=1 Tax=Rathayibacter sp. AY1E1 TaxID=2080549 RepID=UPI000CE90D8F|nr:hypothetical protein [Rathayibacter sp. AY1E1]PPH51212.1 hypothetical protein C5C67_11900 [Rathayibacter sp. AY1E1]
MTTTRTHSATPEQLALILDDQRSGGYFDAVRELGQPAAADAEILAYVDDILALPGQAGMGAEEVVDDGSPLATAYLAYLTPQNL